VLGLAAHFAGAALIAVGLGAPQLAPFAEYLQHSAALADRAARGVVALDRASWPRHFFPDLLGTPVGGTAFAPAQPPPNYEAANLGYVGALALAVALAALPRALRDARTLWLVVIGAAWVLWAHDILGVGGVVARLPLLARIPVSTSQAPWAFAVATCAAFQLHAWLVRPAERAWLEAAAVACAGLACFALFRIGAESFVEDAATRLRATPAALASSAAHVQFVSLTYLAGLAACSALPLLLGRTARLAAIAIVLALAFAQSGGLLAGYNTSCEDRYVFPRPPQLERVIDLARGERMLIVGRDGLLSCSNLAYGVDQPAVYDGLEIRSYVELYTAVFRAGDGWRQPTRANRPALDLFGVRWLLVKLGDAERGAPGSPWAAAIAGTSSVLAWHGRAGEFDVFESKQSRGRQWLVSSARTASDEQQSLALATRQDFAAYESVVLGPDLPGSFEVRTSASAARGTVHEVEREPARVVLDVESGAPAYLVLTLPHYPGWSATLDGHPAPIARANHAFTALDVPAGTHRVELRYEPASWRIGLWIAAASFALGLAAVWSSSRRLGAAAGA
jgi:hypothetical protein